MRKFFYRLLPAGSFSELGVREEENKIRFPEKVIRCIWNGQLFKPIPLVTVTGEKIEIELPEFWSFGSSGPDFSSARIRINGKLLNGDVKLLFIPYIGIGINMVKILITIIWFYMFLFGKAKRMCCGSNRISK